MCARCWVGNSVSSMDINVKEGDRFPSLRGETQGGEPFDLDQFPGKRKVVYFYPKDNTPGCTLEAQTFNGSLADFEAADTLVIGVSADDAESHKSFCDAHGLSFPLVVDKGGEVCQELGIYATIPGFEKFGPFPQRFTFLLDQDNVILRIWRVSDIANHPADVLEALQAEK